MRTMGCRRLVPDVGGRFSRSEMVCIANETRKSSGG